MIKGGHPILTRCSLSDLCNWDVFGGTLVVSLPSRRWALFLFFHACAQSIVSQVGYSFSHERTSPEPPIEWEAIAMMGRVDASMGRHDVSCWHRRFNDVRSYVGSWG